MSKADDIYLLDILECIEIIFSYINDKTETEFINDLMLQDAVVRRFEIIGEAATKISEFLKSANPTVKWRLMKEMRNKLIHEYSGVSPLTLYATIKHDLPILKEQLKNIV